MTIVAALDLASGKRSGRHTHSIEEVVLVLRGTAEMVVDEERVGFSAGDMVLVPALAPHELFNAGPDELRIVAFFLNAAFVSVFDDVPSPVESRVLITPPPRWTPRISRSRPSSFREDLFSAAGGMWEYATTPTRRFPTYQMPALHFSALLNEEAPEVELMLASS